MNKEQALNIIKQTLDQAIKSGVIPNLETAQQILQAFSLIVKENDGNDSSNS
jgi:hypothetical protein